MSNPNGTKGKQWERDLRGYWRERELDTEALRTTGTEDEGDLLLRLGLQWSDRFVIEAKNWGKLNLSGWVQEAEVEAKNYAAHRGIEVPHFAVAVKRRGHGVAKGYVVTTVEEYTRQITRT